MRLQCNRGLEGGCCAVCGTVGGTGKQQGAMLCCAAAFADCTSTIRPIQCLLSPPGAPRVGSGGSRTVRSPRRRALSSLSGGAVLFPGWQGARPTTQMPGCASGQ